MYVFSHLSGQVHTHSIKGEEKNQYDTWVVLRYDSIYYALRLLHISRTHWPKLFRKLLVITDVLYNKKTVELNDDKQKLRQMMGTLRNPQPKAK